MTKKKQTPQKKTIKAKTDSKDSLLTFPCRFPIKAIGIAEPDLGQHIFDVIEKHAPGLKHEDIQFRHSANKNYIGLTITITATSQVQLDTLYRELTQNELIKFVL